MSKYEIKNVEGKKVGDAELSSDVYGIEPNIPVVHQVVVCQDASARQGTHSTKNRHEVSGGGVKPYRQKGTGRARQGSIRVVEHAVKGMLPKTTLGRKQGMKLKVYAGAEHPHAAQNPVKIELEG